MGDFWPQSRQPSAGYTTPLATSTPPRSATRFIMYVMIIGVLCIAMAAFWMAFGALITLKTQMQNMRHDLRVLRNALANHAHPGPACCALLSKRVTVLESQSAQHAACCQVHDDRLDNAEQAIEENAQCCIENSGELWNITIQQGYDEMDIDQLVDYTGDLDQRVTLLSGALDEQAQCCTANSDALFTLDQRVDIIETDVDTLTDAVGDLQSQINP